LNRQRVHYFDFAKGIGIILVVMGHLEYISIPFRYFIASFHMPMFFIISGMLMCMTGEESKSFSAYINNKIQRIAVPYLSFSTLYLILESIYMYLMKQVNWMNIIQDGYLSICLYGISVLWFLPAMFFGGLLLYSLRKKFSHIITIAIVGILTIVMYILNVQLEAVNMIYGQQLWFVELHYFLAMIIRCFFAGLYLAIGYYIYYFYHLIICGESPFKNIIVGIRKISLLIAVILIIMVAYLSQINGAVDIHFLIFQNPFIYLFNSIAGSVAVIILCRLLEPFAKTIPCKILSYYGRNSLIVMATHINSYVLYVAIVISLHFSKYITRAKNYVFCIMILTIVFLSEVLIIEIINRFLPFFAGKKFKK